ncbi:hypothetical protein GGR50DRAFT_696447 [Xylaria sp. CBS 124048]|nr:hypothetical protein GGR50DRAFT_696447 [Xylaria sp. CBS 124048]
MNPLRDRDHRPTGLAEGTSTSEYRNALGATRIQRRPVPPREARSDEYVGRGQRGEQGAVILGYATRPDDDGRDQLQHGPTIQAMPGRFGARETVNRAEALVRRQQWIRDQNRDVADLVDETSPSPNVGPSTSNDLQDPTGTISVSQSDSNIVDSEPQSSINPAELPDPEPVRVASAVDETENPGAVPSPSVVSAIDKTGQPGIARSPGAEHSDKLTEQPATRSVGGAASIDEALGMSGDGIAASASFNSPQDNLTQSQLSLEARQNTIRVVPPDFTLSPPRRAGEEAPENNRTADTAPVQSDESEATTMSGNNQGGQHGQRRAGESRQRSNTASRGHAEPQRNNNSSGIPMSRGHNQSFSGPDRPVMNNGDRAESSERGRTNVRRYEFIDSDDQVVSLSPVAETPTGDDADNEDEDASQADRESDTTTFTDLMRRAIQPSLQMPARQERQQHGGDVSAATGPQIPPRRQHNQQQVDETSTSTTQEPSRQHGQQQASGASAASGQQHAQQHPKQSSEQSAESLRGRRRPPPLNLQEPGFIGMVNRQNDRYEITHNAIRSSRAERFDQTGQIFTSSSVYDDEGNSAIIAPSPMDNQAGGQVGASTGPTASGLQNNRPFFRTASEGSFNVTTPTPDQDTFFSRNDPIAEAPEPEDRPVRHRAVRATGTLNHMRSRSAVGIRERRGRDDRNRQFSSDSELAVDEAGHAMPPDQAPGFARSVTMNDLPRRAHRLSDDLETPINQYNDASRGDIPPTPLTPFIMRARGAPEGARGQQKVLFGPGGWLDDTARSRRGRDSGAETETETDPLNENQNGTQTGVQTAAQTGTQTRTDKGGFVENLKRKAREIAESTSFRQSRNSTRATRVNPIRISLNAREQSLLYCELEYNLGNALNTYINVQFELARLDASKLRRIADGWAQKGRPKVIGFRYDLETQIELISLHINEFRFYGPLQAQGTGAMMALLQAMKLNARCMRIRTFCQPDPVIAKHIIDAQNVLQLIGSLESMQRPLEEVAQFFKVAVDRQLHLAEAEEARRQGTNRTISNDNSSRNVSNGSTQRVRFADQDEGRPQGRGRQ